MPQFKILACSDFHGGVEEAKAIVQLAKRNNCNMMIVAGDIASWRRVEKTTQEVLKALAEGYHYPILMVPGNSDKLDVLKKYANEYDNVHVLHGTSRVYEDILAFVGVGGMEPSPHPGHLVLTPEDIYALLVRAAIKHKEKGRTIVAITHSPPRGILDKTRFGYHAGSIGVRRFLEEFKPLLLVCGHIHECPGVERFENTLVVNTGTVRRYVGFGRTFAIIELNVTEQGADVHAQLRVFALSAKEAQEISKERKVTLQ